VLTHGFTLDEKGMKMSKSLGNVVAPEKVIAEYGADILRLWVAQTDFTVDQRIGPEILKGTADSYRRLRNTLRFILGNLAGFTEAERVAPDAMPDLERWILHRLAELDAELRAGYAAYDFQGVFQKLFQFCTVDLSALYFDIRKDSLYCDAPGSLMRRSARTVLDLLLHRLTTWLAPILVFTTEDVWLSRYPDTEGSVHLEDMPLTPKAWLLSDEAKKKWDEVWQVRRVVTGALEVSRKERMLGSSLEAHVTVFLGSGLRDLFVDLNPAELFLVSSTKIVEGSSTYGEDVVDDTPLEHRFSLRDQVPGAAVSVSLASGGKCQRCWRILPEVGEFAHPHTCERCNAALG
jgi:isoleucyl-tRNA synthetase